MQNEKDEEILLTIVLDENATEARLKAIKSQMDFLRDAAKGLAIDLKDGIISQKQYDEALGRINVQTAKLTSELTTQKKALDDSRKGIVANSGSLNEMSANAEAAKKEYLALTKAERENKDVGGDLLRRIQDLNKEHGEEAKKLGTSRKGVTDYIKDINILGINVGQSIDSFKAGGEGVQTFAKSILSARGAAIAFTAVPIIAILALIVTFFKSTDEGADKLEQGLGFLTAAFDTLAKGIAPIGKLLFDLFTSPLDTIKKLKEGTDDYNISLGGLASAAIRAGQAQAAYIETMQEVEDAENALIVKREQVGLQVDQALLKVKDRSLSEQQKIKILREAGKAEADLAKITLKNANDAYQAIVKLNKERKTSRELTDEETVAQLNAEAEVIQAQRASLNTQQAIRNRETAQIEEDATRRKAAADKAKQAAKDAAQDRVYEAELAVLVLKKRGEESLEIEAELTKRQAMLIQKRGDFEKSGLAKNSAQRKLIEAKVNAELLELAEQHAIKLSEIAYKIKLTEIDTQLALTQSGSEKELDLRVRSINAERVKQVEAARATMKDKEKFLDEEARINAVAARQTGDLRQAFELAQVNREATAAAARLQTQLDLGEQTIANERDVAAKRIDLEEDTQTKLLEVERKYGQVNDTEYLNRLNAIQSKAIAARRDLNKQIIEDERTTQENILDAQLSRVKEGSKEELSLQLAKLKVGRERAIANAKGTQSEIDKINGEFDKKEEDAESDAIDKRIKKIQEKIMKVVDVVSLAKDALSTSYEAETQVLLNNLDKQQEAALKSAGANADLRARIEEQYQVKRAKLEKEAAEKRRKIASVENLIATATAATTALSLFAKNPILGAITEALILVKAVKNQQLIDSQSFAFGGIALGGTPMYRSDRRGAYVRGPGTGTSDSISARISNGESIINARSTAQFYNQLSAMNVAGGGRAFPGAGVEVPQMANFQMGGVPSGGSDANAIAAAVANEMRKANFVVAVTDIHKAETDVAIAVASGNS